MCGLSLAFGGEAAVLFELDDVVVAVAEEGVTGRDFLVPWKGLLGRVWQPVSVGWSVAVWWSVENCSKGVLVGSVCPVLGSTVPVEVLPCGF